MQCRTKAYYLGSLVKNIGVVLLYERFYLRGRHSHDIFFKKPALRGLIFYKKLIKNKKPNVHA